MPKQDKTESGNVTMTVSVDRWRLSLSDTLTTSETDNAGHNTGKTH